MSIETYRKHRKDVSKNGLKNLVNDGEKEPGEIFYFFKEYYLSYKSYTPEEARELAILRFERLIGFKIIRNKIMCAGHMLNRLKKEMKTKDINRFRTANFSEFDIDKMFLE